MRGIEQYLLMSSVSQEFEALSRSDPAATEYLKIARELEERMRSHPEETTTIIDREFGEQRVPRITQTASFVIRFPNRQFVEYALQTLNIPDLNAFLVTSDIAMGISIIMGQVISVDTQLAGKAHEAVELVSRGFSSEGIKMETTDSVEAYLHMADVFKRAEHLTINDSSGTHLADPSGITLVDFLVGDIKTELMRPPLERNGFMPKIQDPRVLIEGVEMGARFYKFAYPLTGASEESGI